MEFRLEHYSLDKEPFWTQVLEIKLNVKQRLCATKLVMEAVSSIEIVVLT